MNPSSQNYKNENARQCGPLCWRQPGLLPTLILRLDSQKYIPFVCGPIPASRLLARDNSVGMLGEMFKGCFRDVFSDALIIINFLCCFKDALIMI